jgi:hypothetical protein
MIAAQQHLPARLAAQRLNARGIEAQLLISCIADDAGGLRPKASAP